jgi:nitrogen regulatory protein PII
VEAIIHDDMVEQAVKAIREATCTNSVGDGKIFIIDVENAIRIRTGEQGNDAI